MNAHHAVASTGLVLLALALATPIAAAATAPAAAPAGKPATAAPAPSNGTFSGKVVETMDAGGYTYVRVDTGKDKRWAAAPKTLVKIGDSVSIVAGMPMADHHSNTLKRDFDMVYFTSSLQGDRVMIGGKPDVQLPPGHPSLGAAAPAADKGGAGEKAAPKPVKIDLAGIQKAKGGKTVQEVYTGKATLKGKEVAVRGRVVKVNANIMGRNWLHLKDGSGNPGSDMLTVTTEAAANVGDLVVATGTIALDKDFGAGYKYGLIMENTKVVVER